MLWWVSASVPPERVLGRDRGGYVGCPARVVHVASTTAVAIASAARAIAARYCSVIGKVTAHERTTHQGRAACLAHRVWAAKGAGASTCHLSPLVLTSDDEHGTSVSAGDGDRREGDAHGLGLLARRRTAARVVFEDITTVAA